MAKLKQMQADGITVLSVSGQLTAEGVGAIETSFQHALDASQRVVVDLSGVTMMTTPGITLVLAAGRSLGERGGQVVFTGIQGSVSEVLIQRCRLGSVLRIAPDLEAAMTELKR